ncbi:MAG: hypothetical protein ABW208_07200 [Pyrinomonadaceae bacterium]
MPKKYTDEAVESCFKLYLRFHGQQHDKIEEEMRKAGWVGWSKQNLYTRGKDKNLKVGWIERYGWEHALKLKLSTSDKAAGTSAEVLFLEIEATRKRIKETLDAGGVLERDLVYQHRDFCKLSIDALARLEAARDNLSNFVAFWERLCAWLPEISPAATRELLAVAEEVLAKAQSEYGGK